MNDLRTIRLGRFKHKTREDGMCLMEAVAYLAGEKHTDTPACASPAITQVARFLNDACEDSERESLLGDLPWRIVGTNGSNGVESLRWLMLREWAGLNDQLLKHVTGVEVAFKTMPAPPAALQSLRDLIVRMIELTEPKEASVKQDAMLAARK